MLDVCWAAAGSETAEATPPGSGEVGRTAVERGEGICGGLDTGAMVPPSTYRTEEHYIIAIAENNTTHHKYTLHTHTTLYTCSFYNSVSMQGCINHIYRVIYTTSPI